MPMMLMLFFGLITFGLTYNDNLSISNAAREGARLGAALDYTPGPSTWATSVQTRVQQVYFNNASTISTNDICVQLVDSTNTGISGASALSTRCTTAGAPAPPSNMVAGSCAVKIWVVKRAKLSWLLVPDKFFDLRADSVAYYGLKAGSCTAP